VHAMDLRLFGQGIALGLCTGDLPLAAELLDQLTATPIVTALDQAYSSHMLADFKLLKGELAEGLVLAELALKRARDGGGPLPIAFCLAGQTLALYQDGQIERAVDVLQQGLDASRGMNYYSSLFHLLAAFFAFESGDRPAAMEKLQAGFGLAARQGYLNFHPWRQEIMTRLCSEAIAAGIEADYVRRLAACHGIDVTPRDVPGLTPKEIEILTWVKEGKTSWEIAKILEISERTVKFHVGNILGKLGVRSRFQAVAVATKVGILTQD
jgi:DNA-binding CsgD family transcriptional regulator